MVGELEDEVIYSNLSIWPRLSEVIFPVVHYLIIRRRLAIITLILEDVMSYTGSRDCMYIRSVVGGSHQQLIVDSDRFGMAVKLRVGLNLPWSPARLLSMICLEIFTTWKYVKTNRDGSE